MKIWITRDSTGSLHSGGLERCRVWFTKPIWVFIEVKASELDEESPFGFDGKEGCKNVGWIHHPGARGCKDILSFGDVFGYGSDRDEARVVGLAEYVWQKLIEHYGNKEFIHGWYEHEKSGGCHRKDFLLEIDLDIKFQPKA